MKPTSPLNKIVPLKMVGGASFGRYPKISPENTFNMLITDNWMVPFPGYQSVKEIDATGEGRGILSSSKANLMFVVIDNTFYSVDENLNFATHGTLLTSNGDVTMAENNANQIGICDQNYLYCYNYDTGVFSNVPFPTVYADNATITYSANSTQTVATIVGTKFTVGSTDIIVTTLGAYQNDTYSIFSSGYVQVGLYDSIGTLLTSATVYPSVNPPNGLNFVSIDPLILTAGQTYSIIQTVPANGHVLSNGTITFPPVINFVSTLSAASDTLAFTAANTYAYTYAFGPAFQYATELNTLTPLYIAFQDTRFLVPANDGQWYLSYNNQGLIYPIDAQHIGEFQTKPDTPVAIVRMPGKGNKLLIFGSNVTEPWSDLGLQLFPYQRDTFLNVDYGCLNSASIAALENYVVWLASNEQSGPTIMYFDGQNLQRISTDGIGYKLANLAAPQDCYGYLFRQYDHIIYGLTFPTDNYSICYDFTSKKFTTLTDYNFNAFPVKRVTFFNNKYYFVSIYNGNLYEINSTIETYNGNEIPLIRITPTFRLPDATRFIVNNVNFPIEQGQGVSTSVDANGNAISTQFIDISVSRDGGVTFGNNYRKTLNPFAVRPNRFNVWSLGSANEITFQFRFLGYNRFVFSDGEISVYQ